MSNEDLTRLTDEELMALMQDLTKPKALRIAVEREMLRRKKVAREAQK